MEKERVRVGFTRTNVLDSHCPLTECLRVTSTQGASTPSSSPLKAPSHRCIQIPLFFRLNDLLLLRITSRGVNDGEALQQNAALLNLWTKDGVGRSIPNYKGDRRGAGRRRYSPIIG